MAQVHDKTSQKAAQGNTHTIPKKIHCCWLGECPKDALSTRCRASWEKFAPDFEIREWGRADIESAGIVIPPFVRDAIAQRKWAFAADWVRFLALYFEGGVYFDYDFELLAPVDGLLALGPFVGGEWQPDGSVGMGPAVIALEKGSPVAKAMLDHYATAKYDGKTTVGEIMQSLGLQIRTLPPEVFSPIDVRGICRRTSQTRGIHHYAMSWATPGRRVAKWLSWHGMRGIVEALLKLKGVCRG